MTVSILELRFTYSIFNDMTNFSDTGYIMLMVFLFAMLYSMSCFVIISNIVEIQGAILDQIKHCDHKFHLIAYNILLNNLLERLQDTNTGFGSIRSLFSLHTLKE